MLVVLLVIKAVGEVRVLEVAAEKMSRKLGK
jgi:hypothetical protein